MTFIHFLVNTFMAISLLYFTYCCFIVFFVSTKKIDEHMKVADAIDYICYQYRFVWIPLICFALYNIIQYSIAI